MSVRNVAEYVNPKDQPRNALCSCGSGKKYKKCCGQPKKMDLTTFYKGRVLDFTFYENTDEKEYDSMLKFATGLKENDVPLCVPGVKFNIKILEIDNEIVKNDLDSPTYKIQIKGEIL